MTHTPYPDSDAGRSSGWSGSDASRERAHREDADGTTESRDALVLRYVSATEGHGTTIHDLRIAYPNLHHGQLSGALTRLHKAGLVHRLIEKRGRCSIYVLPGYVDGRTTAAPTPPRASLLTCRLHGRYEKSAVTANECPWCAWERCQRFIQEMWPNG